MLYKSIFKKVLFIIFLVGFVFNAEAFTRLVHQNIPEDAFVFLETNGTIQQRWVADYLKAKTNGRSNGKCGEIRFFSTEDKVVQDKYYHQCGITGVARTGGTAPDFFIDTFWSAWMGFSYHMADQGLMLNNFSSWSHFINLLEFNQGGYKVVNNVYNDYDGYAYNATYGYTGFPNADWITASVIGNAKMTVDLPNCTNSACKDKFSIYPNANPSTDYKQNGSRTPVGVPSKAGAEITLEGISDNDYTTVIEQYPEVKAFLPTKESLGLWLGEQKLRDNATNHTVKDVLAVIGKQLDNGPLTNYNCFSDDILLPCLTDVGSKDGNGYYVYPNRVLKSNGTSDGSDFRYKIDIAPDQDWVIYEPADNVATFFYNELFLEGGKSRNSTLNKESIRGRYYSLVSNSDYNISTTDSGDLKYLSVVHHWVGDMGQMAHIWSTLGYGHGSFEGFVDDNYGIRDIGQNTEKNYEDYDYIKAALVSRHNRFLPDVPLYKLMMEQAFRTYNVRFRAGYDYFVTTNKNVWKTNAIWGVNNAIALSVLVWEKGILDLRRCRNNTNCDNR